MAPFAIPDGPPPPELTFDYGYRNSVRTWDIITQSICLTISAICLSLRMYSKMFIIRSPGWEDCEYNLLRTWVSFRYMTYFAKHITSRDLLLGFRMLVD